MTDIRLKYADALSLERINTLHPAIRNGVRDKYLSINYHLLGKGIRLRMAYTTRTIAEQNALYAKGRTVLFENGRRIGKVTNAKGGQSIHNYHLAFDIVLLYDQNFDGVFERASWDTALDFDKNGKADWFTVIDAFKEMEGITWGGDWSRFKDIPHFEFNFGLTWRDMQGMMVTKKYFTQDGYEYIIL